MVDDRIITDDALISTDVDKLIRIIAERRKLSLVELQRLSGIRSRNDLDTWIRVLEDEGYVRVEYGLTGTYISWTGSPYPQKPVEGPQPKKEEKPYGHEEPPAQAQEPEAFEKKPTAEDQENAEARNEPPQASEDKSPEELLEEYVRAKRNSEYVWQQEKGHDEEPELRRNIVRNLEDSAGGEKEAEEEGNVPETGEEPVLREETGEPEQTPSIDNEEAPVPSSVYDDDVRELMAAYMEEMKEERERLEQLKRKKEMFYREELKGLQKMSETELLSFIDAVLTQEKKLLELREEVLRLPEKVDGALKVRNELRTLSERAKASARNTRSRAEELALSLKVSENDLHDRINDIRELIQGNEKRISALESLRESIDGRTEKIAMSMDAVRSRVDELRGMLETLEQYLKETQNAKEDVDRALAEMHDITAQKQGELESVESELEDLTKLSAWIREYVNDYDSKIAEIDEHVAKSEKDLAMLKQAAQAAYLKKYLAELQGLSEKYEEKLDAAVKTEKEINAEIEKSKERIAQLVRESQKIIERLGKETKEPDYAEAKKKAEGRGNRLKRLVEEKSTEKKSLSESIRKRKKGRKK